MRCNYDLKRKLESCAKSGYLYSPATESERNSLRRYLSEGCVTEPYPGLYAIKQEHDGESPRARAYTLIKSLAKRHPDWVFCSFSAAVIHGLRVPNACLKAVHTCVSPGKNRRRHPSVVACHSLSILERPGVTQARVEIINGIRVTTIEQTLLDCLCMTNFRNGLVIADSALQFSLTSKFELERWFAKQGKGRRGILQARETLSHADFGSESGGESVVRAAIIEIGFRVPCLQVVIEDPMEPNNPKRVDMGWRREDGTWVLLEVDGKAKYYEAARGGEKTVREMAEAFSKERLRETHLNLTGAVVLRCSVEDAYSGDRLRNMLLHAGVPMVNDCGSSD